MTMHNHAEVGEISERIVLVGDRTGRSISRNIIWRCGACGMMCGVRTAIRECLREYGYL